MIVARQSEATAEASGISERATLYRIDECISVSNDLVYFVSHATPVRKVANDVLLHSGNDLANLGWPVNFLT
jgi:hypothetical protein